MMGKWILDRPQQLIPPAVSWWHVPVLRLEFPQALGETPPLVPTDPVSTWRN